MFHDTPYNPRLDGRLLAIREALSAAVPPGHPFAFVMVLPERGLIFEIDSFSNDAQLVAELLLNWLLQQSPDIVLRAFAVERQAKLDALAGPGPGLVLPGDPEFPL